MALPNGGRIASLALLNTDEGRALLAQAYRGVVENVEQRMISSQLKNRDLSGDLDAGSVEAKRFANAVAQQYGTAAANGLGNIIHVDPVTVPINMHREIVEPLEKYDAATFGVPDLIGRRTRNHAQSMARELERAFFSCAVAEGANFTTAETDIDAILEDLIQTIETTNNSFVDGVPRDMISLVCSPAFYGQIRSYLDKTYNANIDTARDDIFAFHGVRVYASTYLPTGINCIGMIDGAIAQPVRSDVYQAREVPLTNRWSLELYWDYGTTAVMPELIQVYASGNAMKTLNVSSTRGAASGTTFIEVDPLAAGSTNKYVYVLGASAASVAYNADVSSYTDLPADGIVTVASGAYITVVEATSADKAVGVGSAKLVVKA